MGAPAFKHREVFEAHNVHVFSANFALYGDMSSRVMDLLAAYSPDMEIYSIDEAFLKLEGFENINLMEHGKSMRKKVFKNTGIPISVGIATTKALAKAANRIAKKFPEKTGNVYIIDTEEKRVKALKWLPVEDVWGIGRMHGKRLRSINVNNAYDFTQLADSWVKKHLSVVGLRLKKDLMGEPTLQMEEIQQKKSIATTRSFEKNYTTLEQLRERVSTFAFSCSEKLRKQHSCCKALMVFIHTNGFQKEQPPDSKNYVLQLPYPSNSAIELSGFATAALEKIFRKGYAYKKAGVIVMDLVDEDSVQLSIFENSNQKHRPLMRAVDQLNATYGNQKIKLASQDAKRIWKMKQEKLSPRYTTRMEEIITINS
jgi:DNA polymerase V